VLKGAIAQRVSEPVAVDDYDDTEADETPGEDQDRA
jgi:hypothetical protein